MSDIIASIHARLSEWENIEISIEFKVKYTGNKTGNILLLKSVLYNYLKLLNKEIDGGRWLLLFPFFSITYSYLLDKTKNEYQK